MRSTGTCASPIARHVNDLATSCSSPTGSFAARLFRSYRSSALVVLEGYADPFAELPDRVPPEESRDAMIAMWGTGEFQHVVDPDMPCKEEIRAAWARQERLAGSPGTVALMMPLVAEMDVRALLPAIRVPTLVVHRTDDQFVPPAMGKYPADHWPARSTSSFRGATCTTLSNPTGARPTRRLRSSSPDSRQR
jgi:pimeloyl-ACP methyl ester carboxylesterase